MRIGPGRQGAALLFSAWSCEHASDAVAESVFRPARRHRRGAAQYVVTNLLLFTAGPNPCDHPELLYGEGLFGVITAVSR